MNDSVSARAIQELPSVCIPATGARATFPLRRVACVGRGCAAHADMGRNSLTIDEELREDGGPNLMIRKPPEKVALLSHEFSPAVHDVIAAATQSGIAAEVVSERVAVTIGELGEPPVKDVQPQPA